MAKNTSDVIKQQLGQVESEIASVESEAIMADETALSQIGGKLAALGAKAKAIKSDLDRALAGEFAARAKAESEAAAKARADELAAHEANCKGLESRFEAWKAAMLETDERLGVLNAEYTAIQTEAGQAFNHAQKIGSNRMPDCSQLGEQLATVRRWGGNFVKAFK